MPFGSTLFGSSAPSPSKDTQSFSVGTVREVKGIEPSLCYIVMSKVDKSRGQQARNIIERLGLKLPQQQAQSFGETKMLHQKNLSILYIKVLKKKQNTV